MVKVVGGGVTRYWYLRGLFLWALLILFSPGYNLITIIMFFCFVARKRDKIIHNHARAPHCLDCMISFLSLSLSFCLWVLWAKVNQQ